MTWKWALSQLSTRAKIWKFPIFLKLVVLKFSRLFHSSNVLWVTFSTHCGFTFVLKKKSQVFFLLLKVAINYKILSFCSTELPQQLPVITGVQSRYKHGDTIRGNCTSFNSKPVANLTWTINDVPVWFFKLQYHFSLNRIFS